MYRLTLSHTMKYILIAPAHYRIYRTASRRLVRQMGAHAPSPEALIQHELSQRTPRLIADEYLENWRRLRIRTRSMRIPNRAYLLKPPSGDLRRN